MGFCQYGVLSCGILSVWGFVLWGFVSVGFCPVGFCPVGFCPVGFCPVGFCQCGVLSCGILSVWGFVLWGFVLESILVSTWYSLFNQISAYALIRDPPVIFAAFDKNKSSVKILMTSEAYSRFEIISKIISKIHKTLRYSNNPSNRA